MERTKFSRLYSALKAELIGGVYHTVKNGHRDTLIECPSMKLCFDLDPQVEKTMSMLKPNQHQQITNLLSTFQKFWKGENELPAGDVLMNMLETLPQENDKVIMEALSCEDYQFNNLGSINYRHIGKMFTKAMIEDDETFASEEDDRVSFYDEDEDEDLELMIKEQEEALENAEVESDEDLVSDESDVRVYDNMTKKTSPFLVNEDDVNISNYDSLTYSDENPYSQLKRKYGQE